MRYSRKEKLEVPKSQMLAANILKNMHFFTLGTHLWCVPLQEWA